MKGSTPVLIIFFNRPATIKKLMRELSLISPSSIFLASDGPRNNDDLKLIQECRQIVDEMTDWPCTVNKMFLSKNLGCDDMIPKAISWFFSFVEHGIILEDDCIIDRGFYNFSSMLLDYYKDTSKVMNISAANFQLAKWGDGDYYFSKYPTNWAWATWRRAWCKFDQNLSNLDQLLVPGKGLCEILKDEEERRYWRKFFLGLRDGKYTYWDAKWVYSIWANKGISITPNTNLVRNIGFGEDATHTKIKIKGIDMPITEIEANINHPNLLVEYCEGADQYLFQTRYKPNFRGYIDKIIGVVSHFRQKVKNALR